MKRVFYIDLSIDEIKWSSICTGYYPHNNGHHHTGIPEFIINVESACAYNWEILDADRRDALKLLGYSDSEIEEILKANK